METDKKNMKTYTDGNGIMYYAIDKNRLPNHVQKMLLLTEMRTDELPPDESFRPWGYYVVLLDAPNCKVKKIVINPGQAPSYQYHYKREELWQIISGTGTLRLDGKFMEVGPGDRIHIPKCARHQILNDGSIPLEFIEIQTGEYFGEDDIVRLEDIYGRMDDKKED